MAMRTSVAKSPWSGALIAAASIAAVSLVAAARDWDLDSWIWAVAVCVWGGVASAITQMARNRRLDRSVRAVREASTGHPFPE